MAMKANISLMSASRYNRNDRDERPREEAPRDESPREDRPREDRQREERPRDNRPRDVSPRENRPRNIRQNEDRPVEAAPANDSEAGEESITVFEPPVNPFVAEPRGARGLRPRRAQRPPQDDREANGNRDDAEPRGLDPAMLPPAISIAAPRNEDVGSDDEIAAEAAPRRRTRRPRSPADDAGEKLVAG